MQRKLIELFDRRGRLYALFALVVLFSAFYLNTNHLALLTPWPVPLFGFENFIPFLPWTVYIYLTAFLMLPLAIILVGRKDLGRTMAGLAGIMFICGIIFLLLPTAYPRPDLLPAGVDWFTRIIYHFLTVIDTPKNCMPSQHAAACLFVSFALFRRHKTLGIIFVLWTAAILISTLTLKQHYFLDLIAGAGLAVIAYLLSFKKQYDARR